MKCYCVLLAIIALVVSIVVPLVYWRSQRSSPLEQADSVRPLDMLHNPRITIEIWFNKPDSSDSVTAGRRKSWTITCVGSLISADGFILTGGHCFHFGEDVFILGSSVLTYQSTYVRFGPAQDQEPGKWYAAKAIVVHHDVQILPNAVHDLAVLPNPAATQLPAVPRSTGHPSPT